MKKLPTRTEKQITASIRDLLNKFGVWHWKHWGGPMSKKGVSDILGSCWKLVQCPNCQHSFPVDGINMACEVKKPGGKLTKHQKQFLEEVNRNGGIGFKAEREEDVIDKLGLRNRMLF
jgi:hypothetical protein